MEGLEPVSNDGEDTIVSTAPYAVEFTVRGSSPMLFHRWSVEAVAEKAAAAKGSAAKKDDNVESYVWRNEEGELCLPSEYVRQSMIHAAKFRQDPRSPRKSAMDLFKAGIAATDELGTLGVKTWDYLDQRRVQVQRSGITRKRPAMVEGWEASFIFQVLLPEYISENNFLDVLGQAGRVVGVADFRPSYGRFQVVKFVRLG